jgi:transposase
MVTTSVIASDKDVDAGGSHVAGPRSGRSVRRSFTVEYKRRIVAEYEAAPVGSKGAVLRRERLYDSHVLEWRAAIRAGTLGIPLRRRRAERSPEQSRISELEKSLAKAEAELVRKDKVIADREAALEVLGKGVAFLEALSSKNAP